MGNRSTLLTHSLRTFQLLLCAAWLWSGPLQAEEGLGVGQAVSVQTSTAPEALRAGPGTAYPVVARLRPDVALVIVEIRGAWAAVEDRAGERYGWVRLNRLRGLAKPAETTAQTDGHSRPIAPQSALPASGAQAIPMRAIHLEMKPRDAEVLFRKDPNDTSYFDVSVRGDAGPMRGEIEVKGASTRLLGKKSLIVKLKDGQWHGQRRISLDAMATDASRMRQWLSWELIRSLGIPAPATTYTRVYLNGRYIGPYLHIEWIDPRLLASHGLGEDGQFFQATDIDYCGDFLAANLPRLQTCWNKLSPRDQDFSTLEALARGIVEAPTAEFHQFVDRHFDAEALINWMAVNLLAGNNDTYNKNYFLYRRADSGKWSVIPWDYDLTFGRSYDAQLPYPRSIYNDHFQYISTPELGAPSPLKEKAMRNPVLRERFMRQVKHLLGLERHGPEATFGWFSTERMQARIAQLEKGLVDEIALDPYETQGQFSRETDALRHYALVRNAFLKEKLFGAFPWDPEAAYWDPTQAPPEPPLPELMQLSPRIAPGQHEATLADPAFGYLLAHLSRTRAETPIDLYLKAEMNRAPAYLPPGAQADQCVQRSWLMAVTSPHSAEDIDLTLEYLQENSLRQERGAGLTEDRLTLWGLDANGWQSYPARFNPASNSITLRTSLKAGHFYRFVACSPDKTTP